MKIRDIRSKRGVSLIISYVLLVTIAIIMSIIVFSYLRYVANVEPVIDCKSGTSMVVENYVCDNGIVNLSLRNNGRFNVDGFVPTFGGNIQREPLTKLLFRNQSSLALVDSSIPSSPAHDPPKFIDVLKPGDVTHVWFTSLEKKPDGRTGLINFDFIRNLKIQPFVIDDETDLIVPCGESITRQDLEGCQINTGVEVPESSVHYEFENNFIDTQGNADIDRSDPAGQEKYSEGFIGQAADFDGTYFLNVDNSVINNQISVNDISISFWLKKENENARLLKKGQGIGFRIYLNDSKVYVSTSGSEFSPCELGLPDQWQHIVITSKKNDKNRIYVNGDQCLNSQAGSSSLKAPRFDLEIGEDLVGKMDELKIWKLELSAEEVASLYSSYIN